MSIDYLLVILYKSIKVKSLKNKHERDISHFMLKTIEGTKCEISCKVFILETFVQRKTIGSAQFKR